MPSVESLERANSSSVRFARFRSFLEFLRPPRKLRVTREGKYYLGITLGVGFAAINTGNNLLHLLLGLLLALIVISGVLSELSLSRLRVVRRLPHRAQVERPYVVEIEVFNEKKRAPSYAIEVEDLREGQLADKRCFYLKVSPNSSQVAAYRRIPARRGLERHTGFRVATRFPFGIFEKSRLINASGALITYPAVDPVRLISDTQLRGVGVDRIAARGQGDEIFGIRLMRDGDDPRDIYWRRSANPDQMLIKERVREGKRVVLLKLSDSLLETGNSMVELEKFERRIREVASRGVAHLLRGDTVHLHTQSGKKLTATPETGADPYLTFLALVAPSAQSPSVSRRVVEETVEPLVSEPLSDPPVTPSNREAVTRK
jgi:uncharacterized protein (DUF58 family)